MLYYLLLLFFEPRIDGFPNPFAEYDYGFWINAIVEIALLYLAYWVSVIIVNRKEFPKKIKFMIMPVLYALYYPFVWGCFWLYEMHFVLAASIGCLLLINILIIWIFDQIKTKKDDIV